MSLRLGISAVFSGVLAYALAVRELLDGTGFPQFRHRSYVEEAQARNLGRKRHKTRHIHAYRPAGRAATF